MMGILYQIYDGNIRNTSYLSHHFLLSKPYPHMFPLIFVKSTSKHGRAWWCGHTTSSLASSEQPPKVGELVNRSGLS